MKAQDIVLHLANSLNMEQGGIIAQNLYLLYDFIYDALVRANLKKDSEPLQKVKEILMEYFEESEKNIGYYLQNLLPAEFVSICEDLGFQDDEIKKLKKEFEKAQTK
jgi:hypothetical protein